VSISVHYTPDRPEARSPSGFPPFRWSAWKGKWKAQPHRRALLEDLRIDGPCWRTPQTFDDGQALSEAACEHELEGVVAKPLRSRYVPGERGWIKTKNREYWRYEMERESASKIRRERQFV